MPHARRIFKESRLLSWNFAEHLTICSNMIGLYLSTSRFGNTTRKLEAIGHAKKLSQEIGDPYLCVLVASRESSVLRMNDETQKSTEVIQDAMGKFVNPDRTLSSPLVDPRFNAQIGRLIQSRAENLIFTDNIEEAQRELSAWNPIDNASPSSIEQAVQVSIDLTLGRLLKIQGHFETALSQLAPMFERVETEDIGTGGWRRVLLANIGELYCELGRPADARSILIPELDYMKLTKSHNVSSGLRIQLVVAESYLREGSHECSREVAGTVRRVLERSKEHSSISRRFNLRAWTILARIAHMREDWDEALECWRESLKILDLMHNSSGPNAAIVKFSIAHTLQKQGCINESAEQAALARKNLELEKTRRYHFTGFDSYWRDTIVTDFLYWTDPFVNSPRIAQSTDDIEVSSRHARKV